MKPEGMPGRSSENSRLGENGDLDRFEALALRVASAARATALRYFRSPLDIETKSDLSPVTRADRDIEAEARALIEGAEPAHGIFGEEHGRLRVDARWQWIIDPIDGTKSFVTGLPLFGTLLALLDSGRPVLGVIEVPVLGERWVGRADRGTTLDGRPCRTSGCRDLAEASFYTTTVDTFSWATLPVMESLSRACRMRRFGGDCYTYALLASGHVDLILETGLQPYDYMALVPVIEGAGGVITDWHGRALDLESAGDVLASASPELHRRALEMLAAHNHAGEAGPHSGPPVARS